MEEFLKPLEMSQAAFAKHIGVSTQRINEIVRGKRGVTPEFWTNLQSAFDLASSRPARQVVRIHAAERQ